METLKLDLNCDEKSEKIAKAAEILKNDGIVAIPTETVYGLAASAYSDEAVAKVFIAKGRPQDNPLIVHISNIDMLSEVACDIPEKAYKCAEKFWPGPFTMVLKKNTSVCDSVSRGLDTVAVRMPSHVTARAIIESAGIPLAAPSANLSGCPSPTNAYHVINDLDGKIDAVIIDDECQVGVESTVITLSGDTPRLLRPGAVTVEQLREILPDIEIDEAVLAEPTSDVVASPGMKYKHYAPKTTVYLVEGDSDRFADFVNSKKNSAAICFKEDKNINIPYIVYGSECDEGSLAHNVFSVLRDIDKENYSDVYVHAPSKTGVGLAVYNRLIRAAAFKVIKL